MYISHTITNYSGTSLDIIQHKRDSQLQIRFIVDK